jgi:hypothetical protein
MEDLTHSITGTINCFRLSMDMGRFIENVGRTPALWGQFGTSSGTGHENDSQDL